MNSVAFVPVLSGVVRIVKKTPVRTFIIFPLLVISWEFIWNRGELRVSPVYSPLMLWGYLQYRLCGRYRIKRGGGGPGLDIPPDRLVTTGLYAYTRNPMYMGHLIFLTGVALTFQSWFGAAIVLIAAIDSQRRIRGDEKRLTARFGRPYVEYTEKVRRWLPGFF